MLKQEREKKNKHKRAKQASTINKSFLIKRKKKVKREVRKMKKKGKPKSFASIYRFMRASNSENGMFYSQEVEMSTTPLERKSYPFGRNW